LQAVSENVSTDRRRTAMKLLFTYTGLVALVMISLLAAACKTDNSTSPYGTTTPPPPAAKNTISLSGMSFAPNSLTIAKGTTITWQNHDSYVHTSTSDTGVWDTGDIPGGGSKTTTFSTAGTFTYHCTYHRAMGMTGTIIVQ
jgi:plastocyanin